MLRRNDLPGFKISVTAPDGFLAMAACRQRAEVCRHKLHSGITEGRRAPHGDADALRDALPRSGDIALGRLKTATGVDKLAPA